MRRKTIAKRVLRLDGLVLALFVPLGATIPFWAGAPLLGQTPLPLDPSCTATVGNQTAFVDADGKFLLQNVAIFISPQTGVIPELYRVRATCMRDGQMVTGQSPFFELTPGATSFITDIFPTALDPIPVFVTAQANDFLLPPGGTTRITVTAYYADGTSRDITSRAAGTTYLTTNAELLTVDETGLVTGTNQGAANSNGMIAVTNEGNTATVVLESAANSNDFDGDGLPNDYEDLFGLDKLRYDSYEDPDNDGLSNLQEFEIGTLPNQPDTDLDSYLDGVDGDPLRPEMDAPTITLLAPVDGATLVPGQRVSIAATVQDDGQLAGVEFLVNGASFATFSSPPYELSLNVPFAASQLLFTVRATDAAGHVATRQATLGVVPDPLATYQGTVEEQDGTPVAGALVTLQLQGLKGELFDFSTPLTELPDLTGLTPDVTLYSNGLKLRNPGSALSPDTFGASFTPDYAGRFTGGLVAPAAGFYEVSLTADDGGRVLIDGLLVSGTTGGPASKTNLLFLDVGVHALEVDYFQSVGDAEVELRVRSANGGGGAGLRAVGPGTLGDEAEIRLSPSPFTALTGLDGTFAFAGVPTALTPVQADVTVTINDLPRTGMVAIPAGATNLGPIVLDPPPGCVTGTLAYLNCLSGPVTDPVKLYEQRPDGGLTLIQEIVPDPTGRFMVFFRQDRSYVFRREEATCNEQTAACTSPPLSAEPPPSEFTRGVAPDCRDLGEVPLSCDFFGGS